MHKPFDSGQLSEMLLMPLQAALKDAERLLETKPELEHVQETGTLASPIPITTPLANPDDTTEQNPDRETDSVIRSTLNEHPRSATISRFSPTITQTAPPAAAPQVRSTSSKISRFQPITDTVHTKTQAAASLQSNPNTIPDSNTQLPTAAQNPLRPGSPQSAPDSPAVYPVSASSYNSESPSLSAQHKPEQAATSKTIGPASTSQPAHSDIPPSQRSTTPAANPQIQTIPNSVSTIPLHAASDRQQPVTAHSATSRISTDPKQSTQPAIADTSSLSPAVTASSSPNLQSDFSAIRKSQSSESPTYARAAGIPLRMPMPQSEANQSMPAAFPEGDAISRVASTLDPALEQARDLSQMQLDSTNKVSNVFNVNVAVNDTAGKAGIDPQTLQQALADLLYASARRHGLEI